MSPSPAQPIDGAGEPIQASEQPNETGVVPSPSGVPSSPKFAQAEVAAAVQAEQKRIAQALHDTVAQTLTGTYLSALVTVRKLEESGSESAGDVACLAEMIHQAVVELQGVARLLQPEAESPGTKAAAR